MVFTACLKKYGKYVCIFTRFFKKDSGKMACFTIYFEIFLKKYFCTSYFKKSGSLSLTFFQVRTIGSDDTIAFRQCDRAATATTRACARGDDRKNHISGREE